MLKKIIVCASLIISLIFCVSCGTEDWDGTDNLSSVPTTESSSSELGNSQNSQTDASSETDNSEETERSEESSKESSKENSVSNEWVDIEFPRP